MYAMQAIFYIFKLSNNENKENKISYIGYVLNNFIKNVPFSIFTDRHECETTI